MKTVCVLALFSLFAFSPAWGGSRWGQTLLEGFLLDDCTPRDHFPEGEPPYVPLRFRDALPQFGEFISEGGWTTNQVLEGLMFAATNNMTDANWLNEDKQVIAGRAIWKLSEINMPAVTNFFRILNDDTSGKYKIKPVEKMFVYTNLEPEVLAYMRTLCVRTNVYERLSDGVVIDMLKTLKTLPDALKPAATNRVAKFMYFSINHTTQQMAWQDRELAKFIPAYSNSIQRLSAMQYVYSTATNARQRVRAQMEIDRMTSFGTNNLNDVSWIAEP